MSRKGRALREVRQRPPALHGVPFGRLSSVAAALASAHGAADSALPDRDRHNAAVALVLRPPLGEPDPPLGLCELLTIERARSPHDPWSGQMALPGGRLDPADGGLIEAAVRETREETGVRLEAPGSVLGRGEPLRPLRPENPPISVWPFVFSVPSQTTARVASPEVASVHWFALADLADPASQDSHLWRRGSTSRSFPCIRLEGRPIWGLTYRVLTCFMEVALS